MCVCIKIRYTPTSVRKPSCYCNCYHQRCWFIYTSIAIYIINIIIINNTNNTQSNSLFSGLLVFPLSKLCLIHSAAHGNLYEHAINYK